jgi:potassium-transporting ATPase KdpC subunit
MAFLRRTLLPAILVLVALTVLTGVIYPVGIWAVGQVAFPSQANGSLIVRDDGTAVASSLIGQSFTDPKYFTGRLSAAGSDGYDGMASAGSNLATNNANLVDRVTKSVADFRAKYGDAPIPVDLITTSASGLDPNVSPAGADYQVASVAKARGMTEADVRAVVARHTSEPLLGFLGEARVNVVEVNLDLDGLLR